MKKLVTVWMMVTLILSTVVGISWADLNDGLIAYWCFDECDATDKTGSGYNGILSGNPSCEAGIIGKAFYLDSYNDHIRFSGALGSHNIKALSFWINSRGLDGINNRGMVMAKYNWNGRRSFSITSHDGNTNKIDAYFYFRGDTYDGDGISSYYKNPESLDPEKYTIINNTELETNVWKHIVVNITDSELEIWIDGKITNKVKRNYQQYFNSSEPVYLGNAFNMGSDFVYNHRLNGMLDEFRVYNRSLTEAEIDQLATLAIVTKFIPATQLGAFFSFELEVALGNPPYAWSISDGILPSGMNLSDEGVLSGTPTETGIFSFTVRVMDSEGDIAEKVFTIEVVEENFLVLNKQIIEYIEPPFSIDYWGFSAVAGQQVRLENIKMSAPGIVFDLVGPDGWAGFRGISEESELITLPESGKYSLIARYTGEGSNRGYSCRLQETAVTDIAPNTVYQGNFVGSGQAQLFKIELSESTPMNIILDDSASNNSNEMYVKFGLPPTRKDYDYRSENIASSDQQVMIPMATAGEWYVLIYGDNIVTPGAYNLEIETAEIFLTSITPSYHSKNADAVLTLTGVGFDSTVKVELVETGGMRYLSGLIEVDSFTKLNATFSAGSVPAGIYSVVVSLPDGASDQLINAFEVTQGIGAKLETNLIVPSRVGYHNVSTIWVEYANTGDAAMKAPLLSVTATQREAKRAIMKLSGVTLARGFWTSAMPKGFSNTVQFLATGETPGVLQPGESFKVPIQFAGWQKPWDFSYSPITFKLGILKADDNTKVDWNLFKDQMRPDEVNNEIWNPLWMNFVDQAGTTWGDYVTMLTDNASYLGRLGERVIDIKDLLSFEFIQANALNIIRYLASYTESYASAPGIDISIQRIFPQSISGRYNIGAFGRGWAHNWDVSLNIASDGTVTIKGPAETRRIFQPDSRKQGVYFSMEGDYATLTALGSSFSLREPGGLARVFRADGLLDYIEDTNGNRITAGYLGSLLTSLTHSSGQEIKILYSSGRISKIIDSKGRETVYTYDVNSEHLTSVRYFDGLTINYSYSIGGSEIQEHALTEVTFPGGTHQYFTYDNWGRLSTISRDEGKEKAKFSYNTTGMVTVKDAFDNPSQFYLNHQGMLVKVKDPKSQAIQLIYDDNYNLIKFIDSAGRSLEYEYNKKGNVINFDDFLGNSTRFQYSGQFNRLSKLVDANGNATNYSYDGANNLQSITYADNTIESWAYDEQGNIPSWVNRRGNPITYEYNSDGRVTAEAFLDGSRVEYSYDTRGNLILAKDSRGGTTLQYDTAERLQKIIFPDNRFLEYTYNTAGQRKTSTNHLGHTLNYFYNTIGGLESITNETGEKIVHYYYDDAGRLAKKMLGNGVYTLYGYDNAWQLTSLINYKPDGSILSQFIYTFDKRARCTSMTTLEGLWSYEYDDLGQLTAWTAPDGQQVEYQYDALGNRLLVIDNGVETKYTVNNLNQYRQVGNITYVYDDDGNMIQRIAPSGTSSYTYNDANRLVAVSSPQGNWNYTYDAFGNRIRVDDNGTVTDFVIDPIGLGDIVGEYKKSTGDLIAYYDHSFGLLSRFDDKGNPSFYTLDLIGSTREMTGISGAIQNTYNYAPFGELRSITETVNNPFEYVGEYGVMNDNNDLHYMRARFYDSYSSHFSSIDPLRFGGDYTNTYRYVSNNPVNFIDPSGLKFVNFIGNRIRDIVVGLSDKFNLSSPLLTWLSIEEYAQKQGYQPGFVTEKFLEGLGDIKERSNKDLGEYYLERLQEQELEVQNPKPEIEDSDKKQVKSVGPSDPNEKIGPAGIGEAKYVSGDSLLSYRVNFENDRSADVPAHIVTITDQLDNNLDWNKFELTEIGFGDVRIPVPDNTQHFEWTEPMSHAGVEFEVIIDAGINLAKGEVYANFYSIDPATGLPPSIDVGFLPPEDETGRGQGYFSYTIKPKQGVPSGTEIRNIAYITFDFQGTIATNQIDPHDPSKGTDPGKECLNTIGTPQYQCAILGYVRTANGTGIEGVVLSGLPDNPVTDTNGFYSAIVSSGWSGLCTPQKQGYTFDPINWTYSNVNSDQAEQNYTGMILEEPSAPTGLTAYAKSGKVGLQWNAADGAASYNIYRGDTGEIPIGSSTTTTYIDYNVVDGTTYTYRVTALDSAGNESLKSELVSAKPTAERRRR